MKRSSLVISIASGLIFAGLASTTHGQAKAPSAAVSESCEAVLILQTDWQKVSSMQKLSLLNIVSREVWEKKDVRAKVSAVLPTSPPIPINASYDEFRERRDAYFQSVNFNMEAAHSGEYLKSFVTDQQVNAWLACMKAKIAAQYEPKLGLSAYGERSLEESDPRRVSVTLIWRPFPGGPDKIEVNGIEATNGRLKMGDRKVTKLGREPIIQSWEIEDAHKGFQLLVKTKAGDSLNSDWRIS